jgi:hypothetical protein
MHQHHHLAAELARLHRADLHADAERTRRSRRILTTDRRFLRRS